MAIDFSPAMLDKARERSLDAEFALVDICAESPPGKVFDDVFCFNAFPHFRDQSAALRQMRRSLRPGGRLSVLHLVGSEHLNSFHQRVGGAVGHDRLPPAREWPALLEPAALRVTRSEDQSDLFLIQAVALPESRRA